MSTEYKDEIEVWVDDYNYDINLQCKDNEGNVYNLTNYTLKVRVAEQDATTSKFIATGTATDAANGKLKFTVVSGNFDTFGKTYTVVVVATKAAPATEVTFGGLQIKVMWKPPATT